jgi:hypothetical protein
VVVKEVKTSVDWLGYGVVLWPVPVRVGELVGFHDDELTAVPLEVGFQEDELTAVPLEVGFVDEDEATLEDELMEDFVAELEEEEPVAQDDFPTQASFGMAAAVPARAATKRDREACIVSMCIGRMCGRGSSMVLG